MKVDIVLNNLDEAKVLSDQACKVALEKCGQVFEDRAKSYAPVDTGRLRNSISHKMQGNDTVVIETNVEYAIYQEMGTRYQSGTPFMRPAGENHVQEYFNIIEQSLK